MAVITSFAALIKYIVVLAFFAFPFGVNSGEQSCNQYNLSFYVHDLPQETFSYIAWRESRCDESQSNFDDPNGGSFGLLQINAIHIRDVEARPQLWTGVETCQVGTTDDLLVAWKNICFAGFLYAHAGGDPWRV